MWGVVLAAFPQQKAKYMDNMYNQCKNVDLYIDLNRSISQTAFEGDCDTYEDEDGMYVFTAKCSSLWIASVVACKRFIENGGHFETKDKEMFFFIKKVWTKCSKVMTNQQVGFLADELSEKMQKMLKNGIVVRDKYSEDDDFGINSCYNLMLEMFVPFVELHEGEYCLDMLFWQASMESMAKFFLETLKGYIVFNEKYKDFTFSEVQDFEDMYSSMKRLIEELPTGDK